MLVWFHWSFNLFCIKMPLWYPIVKDSNVNFKHVIYIIVIMFGSRGEIRWVYLAIWNRVIGFRFSWRLKTLLLSDWSWWCNGWWQNLTGECLYPEDGRGGINVLQLCSIFSLFHLVQTVVARDGLSLALLWPMVHWSWWLNNIYFITLTLDRVLFFIHHIISSIGWTLL